MFDVLLLTFSIFSLGHFEENQYWRRQENLKFMYTENYITVKKTAFQSFEKFEGFKPLNDK